MKKFTLLFVFVILANVIIGSSAFGQITQVTGSPQTATATASTTLTITKPSGLAAGHVMIVNILQSGVDNNSLSDATGSGWTEVAGSNSNSGNNRYRATLLYKIADATDAAAANFAFTLDSDMDDAEGTIVAFAGVDVTGGVTQSGTAGGPFDLDPDASYNAIAAGNNLNADDISTATANAAVIMFSALADNENIGTWSTTSPGALTELYDAPFDGTGGALDIGIGAAWAIKAAAGNTGDGTAVAVNSPRSLSILIALRLAPPPSVSISPSTTQTIFTGGTVNFTATANNYPAGGNYVYDWSAAGATIPGLDPNSIAASSDAKTLTFPAAGAYSVSVNITRSGTGTNLTTSTITVNAYSVDAGVDQLVPNTTASLNGSGSGPGVTTYLWTRQSGPNTPTLLNATSANASLSGLIAGTYVYRLTLNGIATVFDEVSIHVSIGANLWATSSNGTQVSSFSVSNGTYNSGPTNIYAPDGGSTAALGRTDKPSQQNGYFYWLPNDGSDGVVNVYGASAAGNNETLIGSLDINTNLSNNDIGFVRLCMGPDGKGYILAREDNTNAIYLATFIPNGVNTVTITIVDPSVTISGGAGTTFVNGDIAVSGNGTMFALANNGSGVTQIFVGLPNGGTTTLTKKWDLIVNANGPGTADDVAFTGTVNGVAFDALGSLYISCADGLYYINQATVNGADGTVVCSLVHAVTGLQDLASNFFPNQTQLPVDLVSFTGSLRNNITSLYWETENEQNFDHFEIERRTDNAAGYTKIGVKASLGSSLRSSYSFDDNLAGNSGNAFNYRLKIVDQDGKFKYSNVILIRKDQKILRGVTLSPNPVIGGIATARFSASEDGMVNMHIVDMSGKTVLTQMAKVFEGENSVSINNLDRLQPGIYLLKMENNGAISTIKFSVAR